MNDNPADDRQQRKRRAQLGVGLTSLLFIGAVIYGTTRIPSYECEVCIEFHGVTVCRIVQAATQEEARSSGMNNACALVASGVTDTLACERQVPLKLECREVGNATGDEGARPPSPVEM